MSRLKILYLGPPSERVLGALESAGDSASVREDAIGAHEDSHADVDFIVSFGYRHILGPAIVSRFRGRAVNLHISLLPWNRGADPNLWSVLEDTPKGVTIHLIDEGVDTGDILAQETVTLDALDTLRTSYARLSAAVEALFCRLWPDLRAGRVRARPQPPGGTFHRKKDRAQVEHLLSAGWDTPLRELAGKALPKGA